MISKEFVSTNIENIKIKHKTCDLTVTISNSENDSIKVLYEGNSEISFNSSGNSLYIENKDIKSFFISFFNQSENIEITIPKNKNIYISILSGDIQISGQGFNSQSDIKQNVNKLVIKQTSGDLFCKNILCSESIITTTSGDIDCKNCYFNNAQITGVSSDISLDNFGSKILTVSTLSGDIDINLTSTFKNIKLNTKSGDIDIFQPFKELNYKLKAISGDIEVNDIKFNEEKPILTASSLSGDIELNVINKTYTEPTINEFKEFSREENEQKNNLAFKIDEKNKVLDMLLNHKIQEKDASDLLKSLGYSENEIHNFFEEYIFLKIKNDDEDLKKNNSDENLKIKSDENNLYNSTNININNNIDNNDDTNNNSNNNIDDANHVNINNDNNNDDVNDNNNHNLDKN